MFNCNAIACKHNIRGFCSLDVTTIGANGLCVDYDCREDRCKICGSKLIEKIEYIPYNDTFAPKLIKICPKHLT